jgi:tetratricopeptide (TPR) repeat protein
MGLIELKKENYTKAIDYLNKAISLLPYPSSSIESYAFYMNYLALAYYESGDLDKAQEEYERITALTNGRLLYGDIYAKSFYMLGKIYEQQGNKANAIEHYEKFLFLWKDADPGIAEVEDARVSMAGLR